MAQMSSLVTQFLTTMFMSMYADICRIFLGDRNFPRLPKYFILLTWHDCIPLLTPLMLSSV